MSGKICWTNGPFPCGQKNDWQIFRYHGLCFNLDENERVEADDGYLHGDPEFCKTPSGIHHPAETRTYRNRVMARQETVNKRYKQWGILNQIFRHELEKHQFVFRAVSVLTQMTLESGNPLFDTSEYVDV